MHVDRVFHTFVRSFSKVVEHLLIHSITFVPRTRIFHKQPPKYLPALFPTAHLLSFHLHPFFLRHFFDSISVNDSTYFSLGMPHASHSFKWLFLVLSTTVSCPITSTAALCIPTLLSITTAYCTVPTYSATSLCDVFFPLSPVPLYNFCYLPVSILLLLFPLLC